MTQAAYKSWTGTVEDDESMGDSHVVSWQAIIDNIVEADLSGLDVLDFGCNQGKFLRQLYAQKPFKSGTGIDLAADTIEKAGTKITKEPISYAVSGDPSSLGKTFDLAFSHEVLYLIPDLKQHAQQMHKALKPGGCYYIALGAHTHNPMWERWHKIVTEFSPVPPQNYSAEMIADAFTATGFKAYAQKMPCRGFLNYNPASRYYEHFYEKLTYYFENFVLFRMVRT
jgi:SAM-dependent methyltransferase